MTPARGKQGSRRIPGGGLHFQKVYFSSAISFSCPLEERSFWEVNWEVGAPHSAPMGRLGGQRRACSLPIPAPSHPLAARLRCSSPTDAALAQQERGSTALCPKRPSCSGISKVSISQHRGQASSSCSSAQRQPQPCNGDGDHLPHPLLDPHLETAPHSSFSE